MFYKCFLLFFCFFCFFFAFFVFSVRHKNTRQPFSGTAERIFMQLLPNDSGENGVCIAVPKLGLGPRLIFWGLKTTHCALDGDAWRMTQKNYFMLVCWLWHCAATAVASQMHEGVNAFNLVFHVFIAVAIMV